MLSRRFCFLLYLVAGLLQVHCTHAQISKGHQILINRGLQLQGLVTPDNWFHPDNYSNANYTTVGFSWNSTGNLGPPSTFLGPPPGSPWGRWVSDETNMPGMRSEEHTSELQSHSCISYAVFCLKKKTHRSPAYPASPHSDSFHTQTRRTDY